MKEEKTKQEKRQESISEEMKSKKWEKPTLEDVSEKVMAQPYIRFT